MFFGKKHDKEIEVATKKLDESHARQVEKIEIATKLVSSVNEALITGAKVRHVTEAIAAATGALKR